MTDEEKKKRVIAAWKSGSLRVLGDACYSLPSTFFVFGITPEFVHRVLTEEMKKR